MTQTHGVAVAVEVHLAKISCSLPASAVEATGQCGMEAASGKERLPGVVPRPPRACNVLHSRSSAVVTRPSSRGTTRIVGRGGSLDGPRRAGGPEQVVHVALAHCRRRKHLLPRQAIVSSNQPPRERLHELCEPRSGAGRVVRGGVEWLQAELDGVGRIVPAGRTARVLQLARGEPAQQPA